MIILFFLRDGILHEFLESSHKLVNEAVLFSAFCFFLGFLFSQESCLFFFLFSLAASLFFSLLLFGCSQYHAGAYCLVRVARSLVGF